MTKTYLTSFCNKPHCLKTGKPVDHECYIIPVEALKLEIEGEYEGATEIVVSEELKRHEGIKSE